MRAWTQKKLKEVCTRITDGTHQTPSYFNEGIIFLSSKNVTTGRVDWDNIKYIDEKQHKEMHKRVAPKIGDILLAKNGTTGVAAMVDRDVIFDIYVSLALLRPLEGLNASYLLHFINSPLAKRQFNKRLKGIGVPNLHLEEIREVEIPVPPLPEQQRIVAILDEVFAVLSKAKANAEKNMQNAKALFESYLQNVFENGSWEVKRLEDLCDLITCGVAATPKYVDESVGVPFLSAQNVRDGDVVLDKYKYISKEFHRELTKKNKPQKGDILYSRVGSKFGEAGVVKHDFEFSVYVSLTLIKPKSEILNNYYLKYYLNSPFIKELAKKSITSSGVPNLNVKDVREFPIKCPPLSIQKKIVTDIKKVLAETQKLESIYQQKLEDFEELKKSILQKAFNGELTTERTLAV